MKPETILVVDDNPAVLTLAKLMLATEGYRVYAAQSAKQAIAIAQEVQFGLDLLLTDMLMPEVDGHDLIVTIRRMCPLVRTMVMSGFSPEDSRQRDYLVLPKPFTQDQLLATVKQILDPQDLPSGS